MSWNWVACYYTVVILLHILLLYTLVAILLPEHFFFSFNNLISWNRIHENQCPRPMIPRYFCDRNYANPGNDILTIIKPTWNSATVNLHKRPSFYRVCAGSRTRQRFKYFTFQPGKLHYGCNYTCYLRHICRQGWEGCGPLLSRTSTMRKSVKQTVWDLLRSIRISSPDRCDWKVWDYF